MKDSLLRLSSAGENAPFLDEFPPECKQCLSSGPKVIDKCPIDGRKARLSKIEGANGVVIGCAKKKSLVESDSLHERVLRGGLDQVNILAPYKRLIVEKYEKAYKRLLHNVERNDAHIIQEFQNVVPDKVVIGSQKNYRAIVADHASADIMLAAKALINVFKAAISIKNELTIYQRLYVEPVWRSEMAVYRLHSVFMNTAYKFYDEFNDYSIWLNVGESYDYVNVDFESVSVVLFHLMDNTRKYAKPSSEVFVHFERSVDSREASIRIEMISLAVEESEKSRILIEGYSGYYAQKMARAGKGIGMSIVNDIVTKSGLSLTIDWDIAGKREMVNGYPYTTNRFILGKLELAHVKNAPPRTQFKK